MKKIVSFCLFGNKKLYCQGMIENLKEMEEIYPGWIARIYYSDDVPIEYIEKAKKYNPELIKKERKSKFDGTLWRFLPLLDKEVEIWISRDCDSRINYREAEAVKEWLKSDKSVHIMRDSIYHNQVIQAGMFGVNNKLFNSRYKIDLFNQNQNFNDRNSDQIILFKVLWPKILNDHFSHDVQGNTVLPNLFFTVK